MKKLMIAALVAAMGGVTMADDDACGELKCPFVYRIKLAGKTVTGLATASNKVTCVGGECWVKPTSLRIAGYFYGEGLTDEGACGEICQCKDGDAYLANYVFWDANKREVKLTPAFQIFEVLRNSGAKNKVQILLALDGLNLAGFGAFNPKTGNLKNASGFFAGHLEAAKCAGKAGTCGDPDEEDAKALVYAPCGDLYTGVESAASIAFGRWNLAYKADKVALANKIAAKYGTAGLWETKGLVRPTAFVPATAD